MASSSSSSSIFPGIDKPVLLEPKDIIDVSVSMRPKGWKVREHFLPNRVVYLHIHEASLKGLGDTFLSLLNELFPSIYFDLTSLKAGFTPDAPVLYVGAGEGYRVSDEMLEFLKSYGTTYYKVSDEMLEFFKSYGTYPNLPHAGRILGVQIFSHPPGDTRDADRKNDLFTQNLKKDGITRFVYRAITMHIGGGRFSRKGLDKYYVYNKLAFIGLSHWLAYVCNAADAFIPRSLDLMTNPMWHPQNSDLRRRFRIAYYKTAVSGLEPPTEPSVDEYYDPVYDMSTWFSESDKKLHPMKKAYFMPFQHQRAYDLAVAGGVQKGTPTGTSGLLDDVAQKSSKRSERSDGPSSPEERSEKALRVQSEIAKLATLIGNLMD